MRYPKRRRLVALIVVATAIGLGVAGRAGADPPARTFAGSVLADAVLFDEGPAAIYLAGFPRPDNQWTDAARRHRVAIDDAIGADPSWAASFAHRLQSGDVTTVDGALRDLAVLARAQADRLFGPTAVDRSIALAARGDGLYALVPPYEQQALDLLIQRTDVVATAYILVMPLAIDPGPQGQFLRERLVAEIAANLNVNR